MTNHPMHRVVSFAIVGPHELEVGFEDGVVRRINFLPVLEGELFGPLKDLSVFNQVALSPEGYTLLWPNGADFDPATLHDWPEVEAEFIAMAQSWATDWTQIRHRWGKIRGPLLEAADPHEDGEQVPMRNS